MTDKAPGQFSIPAEQELLGALLYDDSRLPVVMAEVGGADFYDPLHQRTYETMLAEAQEGRRITARSMTALMRNDPGLATLNMDYFGVLEAAAPAVTNFRELARIVRELAMRRQAITACQDAVEIMERTSQPVTNALRDVVVAADTASQMSGRSRPQAASVVAQEVMERARRVYAGEHIPMVTTGLRAIDDHIGGMQGGDFIVVPGRSGMGKEQPLDTPVLTPNGWVSMGSLKVGDAVIGKNGLPTRVQAVWPQGIKQAYKVIFRDKTWTECGVDHRWAVIETGGRNKGKLSVKPLRDMITRGAVRKPSKSVRMGANWKIPVVSPIYRPHAALPVDPYVLGVLIGDGAISGKDLRYSNPDMDADIRSFVACRLPADIVIKENRSGACPYFSLGGAGRKAMRAAIAGIGLAVKSGEKFIPHIYKMASVEQRRDMLRGLMDTDGSCHRNRTCFHTTSRRLADDLAEIVRSLGGIAIINPHVRTHENKPTEYNVNVKMDVCPFYTTRKASEWRPTPPCKAIFAIEPSRVVEQQCITVEAEDGLYVTTDFIVTHNSALLGGISLRAAMAGHPVLDFSLEMMAHQWIERNITDLDFDTAIQPIPYQAFRKGNLTAAELDRCDEARARMPGPDLREICADRGLTVHDIGARARAFKAKHPDKLGLIVIDYLQIIQPPAGRDRSREQEVSQIASGLKSLAKALDWPVMAGAQLLTKGGDPRMANKEQIPTLAGIRESGGIEMEADIIMAPHRKSFYLRKSRPDLPQEDPEYQIWLAEYRACKNLMKVFGLKHRHGAEFDVDLYCNMMASAIRDHEPSVPMSQEDRNARDLLDGLG